MLKDYGEVSEGESNKVTKDQKYPKDFCDKVREQILEFRRASHCLGVNMLVSEILMDRPTFDLFKHTLSLQYGYLLKYSHEHKLPEGIEAEFMGVKIRLQN